MLKINFFKIALLLVLAVFVTGCVDRPEEISQIAAMGNVNPEALNKIRETAIKETAGSIGAQAGLAWRTRELNDLLTKNSHQLDEIFNFNAILLSHNVLPPVLVEERDSLTLDDSETIRLASRDYQILFPARFVTAAPTWRDYIFLVYKKPDIPNYSLLPKSDIERTLWNKYIKIGWQNGIDQANQIFNSNLNRLKRDFGGMILYRKLYAQKIVSAPFVAQADLGITGGGNSMRINDRVLRITAISELDPNSKHWQPAAAPTPPTTAEETANVNDIAGADLKLRNIVEKLK